MNVGNLATVLAAVTIPMMEATLGHAHAALGTTGERLKIEAHTTNAYRLPLAPGAETVIDVQGTSATGLACEADDAQGSPLAKAGSVSEHCVLTFVPNDADAVVIRVVNTGAIANEFVVTTR